MNELEALLAIGLIIGVVHFVSSNLGAYGNITDVFMEDSDKYRDEIENHFKRKSRESIMGFLDYYITMPGRWLAYRDLRSE